jgi:hypothetical protein
MLLVGCLFGLLPLCMAQIDPSGIDKKLLEHEIKTLIDSTRLANNLPVLFNDSILYVASNHHANYLVSKGVLSHEEREKKEFLTPQDRANYYGAPNNYFVGENIVYTVYNASVKVKDKTFQTTNYQEIARSLVYSWVNSKGHFKNIIDPDYQVTGLAIAVDPKLKRIYACQKFAQVLYSYSFPENETFFPYSHLNQDSLKALTAKKYLDLPYPHDLRDDKTEQCEECRQTWEQYPPMSVRISNNYFILRVENADFVKELIRNKHDGFAIEIVPFDAFACGNPAYENEPSRRNAQKRTSGQVLAPVYRNDLIKGFKKRKKVKNLSFVKHILTADSVSFFKRFGQYKLVNFDAKYFEIKLGKVPKDLNGWWNHNLMYIHNKQICHVLFLTNYPGELVTELVAVDYLPPVPVNNYEFKLEHYADTLELFYDAGQTVTSGKVLDNTINYIEQQHLTIKSIRIQGYCSVEGDSLTNEYLHQQRATTILEQLKSLTEPTTQYSIQSQVAWDHFYQAVKNHPKWSFLYPLSKSDISTYLANPKNVKPTEIFSQERKVKVEIIAVKELSARTAYYYIQRDLKNLFYKDDEKQLHCSAPNALERLYEKAYYLSRVDTLSKSDFLKIEIPKFVGGMSHHLQHDIAFYHYDYQRLSADKTQLGRLEGKVESIFNECGAAEHLTPEFHYLSACLLVKRIERKGDANTPENPDIEKALDRLNGLLNAYNPDSILLLNACKANLNIINTLCENIDPEQVYVYTDIVNSSLIQVVEYYRNHDQLNPKTAVRLAQMACYFKNIPLAVELCQGFLYDNEVLKLYLPLAYVHSSYLTGNDELLFELEFHRLLLEAKSRLTASEWCKLFYGQFGIPFQVMDNAGLHTEFCATCPNRVNEVFEEK